MLNAQATVRQHGLAGGGDAPGRGPRAATEPAHSPKTFSVFFSVAPLRSRFSEPRGLQRQEDQSGAGADGRRCSGWEPRPGPDRLGFKRKSCKRGVAYTRIAEAARLRGRAWPPPWEGRPALQKDLAGGPSRGPLPGGATSARADGQTARLREDSRGFRCFYHILGEPPRVGGVRSTFKLGNTVCVPPAVQPRGPSACRRPRNLDAPLPLLPQQEAIKEVKISHEEHAGPKRTGLGREQQTPSLPPGVRVPWAPPGFLTAHFP